MTSGPKARELTVGRSGSVRDIFIPKFCVTMQEENTAHIMDLGIFQPQLENLLLWLCVPNQFKIHISKDF